MMKSRRVKNSIVERCSVKNLAHSSYVELGGGRLRSGRTDFAGELAEVDAVARGLEEGEGVGVLRRDVIW